MENGHKRDIKHAAIAGVVVTCAAIGHGLLGKFSIFAFPGLFVAALVGGGLDYISPFALWVVFPLVNCILYSVIAYLTIVLTHFVRRKRPSGAGG